MTTRRQFLIASTLATVAALEPGVLHARGPKHPTPRKGIDASKVVANADLKNQDATAAFDDVRAIPQIIDGIRCNCGCAEWEGKYSLLSCYEGDAMAQHCEICQGQARLARRMFRMRRTLDQIRTAIDAQYGK